MAREGLSIELSGAIREAKAQNKVITLKGIRVKTNGDFQTIDLTVKPVAQPGIQQFLYMIVFVDASIPPKAEKTVSGRGGSSPRLRERNLEIEKELKHTKELLQTTMEEMQLSQEELKSTNEELQSANEELQSTNEELSSSKEEMQSLNEELMTVNTELHFKIDELTQAYSDMKNMLNRTEIATVFLDNNLNIRKYTPQANEILKIIQSDIGRPISHIVSNLKYDNMANDVRKVLDSLNYQETQVQTREGRWYIMRIMPYRTHNNAIDGVVINFIDVTVMKEMELALQEKARMLAEGIISAVREPLLVLDADFKIVKANESFYKTFNVTPEETENQVLYALGNRQWDIPQLRKLLEDVLPRNSVFNDFEVEHEFQSIGRKKMVLNARKIILQEPGSQLILLAIEDTSNH